MRALTFAAVLLAGCAHRAVTAPPTTGWRELRSRHFRLRTDLPNGSARATLEKLESVRGWLQSAWTTGGDSRGTTQAIVLASPAELRTFTEIMGLATTTREGPLLVTAGYEGLMGDRSPALPVLAHEVAHELIRRRMPGAPRWYQEGLAGYLEWVQPLRAKGSSRLARNVRTELEAAVKEAPGEVVPQVRLASLERDPSRRGVHADELVARFPQSPEALVFRAAVLRDEGGPPEERRAAALAAIASAPDSVDALTAHALEELRVSEPEHALVTISHAVDLEPWNSSVFVVRALILGAIGRCEEASIEAQRAIDVLPDDPVYGDLRALIDERERIIKACASAASVNAHRAPERIHCSRLRTPPGVR